MTSLKEFAYDWMGANTWLFQQVNALSTHDTYNNAMLYLSELGNKSNIPYFLIIMAAYVINAALYRKMLEKGGTRYFLQTWLGVFLVLGVSMIISIGIIDMLKAHFAFPRPYAILDGVHHIEPPREATYNYRSFPSGHATVIMLLVASLWPVLVGYWRWAGFALILLVCWSRMALGVHFPADLVAGSLITLSVVFCVRGIIYKLLHRLLGVKC